LYYAGIRTHDAGVSEDFPRQNDWARVGETIRQQREQLGYRSVRAAARVADFSETLWRQLEGGRKQIAPGTYVAPTASDDTRRKLGATLGWREDAIDLLLDGAPVDHVEDARLKDVTEYAQLVREFASLATVREAFSPRRAAETLAALLTPWGERMFDTVVDLPATEKGAAFDLLRTLAGDPADRPVITIADIRREVEKARERLDKAMMALAAAEEELAAEQFAVAADQDKPAPVKRGGRRNRPSPPDPEE
jgi:hypothetical protein